MKSSLKVCFFLQTGVNSVNVMKYVYVMSHVKFTQDYIRECRVLCNMHLAPLGCVAEE